MANSEVQLVIETWIRDHWMPLEFGHHFSAKRMILSTGGHFDFDAVSEDGTIIANISTSNALTARRKMGTAKIQKLRADMLFLTMVEAKQRIIILSEKDMYELCIKEKRQGRVPNEIDFYHAEIPGELEKILRAAKLIASEEVTSPGVKKSGRGDEVTSEQ